MVRSVYYEKGSVVIDGYCVLVLFFWYYNFVFLVVDCSKGYFRLKKKERFLFMVKVLNLSE